MHFSKWSKSELSQHQESATIVRIEYTKIEQKKQKGFKQKKQWQQRQQQVKTELMMMTQRS
jgi:hypothetical protein